MLYVWFGEMFLFGKAVAFPSRWQHAFCLWRKFALPPPVTIRIQQLGQGNGCCCSSSSCCLLHCRDLTRGKGGQKNFSFPNNLLKVPSRKKKFPSHLPWYGYLPVWFFFSSSRTYWTSFLSLKIHLFSLPLLPPPKKEEGSSITPPKGFLFSGDENSVFSGGKEKGVRGFRDRTMGRS